MPAHRGRAPHASGQSNSSVVFLDTRGQPTLGIGLCQRCQTKRRLADLVEDGNLPGFYVCRAAISPGCWDTFDPFRLPAPPPDNMRLPFVRPDVPLIPAPAPEEPVEPLDEGGSLLSFGPISGGPISAA